MVSIYRGMYEKPEKFWVFPEPYEQGGFVIDVPGYEQPMEMFLIKGI